ncbi:MAG: mannitol dehydrogenase family protein [Lachnospiraceae bacterium]|nr:mannitol dehydrogenase family protein [Lachnospiraceae bacterium]
MKLNSEGLKNTNEWTEKGYSLPHYDREGVKRNTVSNPKWIHFGAGNIFRAFQANVVEKLLNESVIDTGLIVAEGYDYEIVEKMNRPHDDLSILVTLKANGRVEKTVVGSIVESCILDEENEKEIGRLKEIFRAPSLQMVSFTITEKGYKNAAYMSKVTRLLYERYLAGSLPVAMVSMDNCSHNGDKLYEAVMEFAKKWEEEGVCEKGFVDYAADKSKVSFPLSMIDKITPRPDANIEKILLEDGIEDLAQLVTSKNTYVAPFVNAEETEYLVIEDKFPNGRAPYEKGGIIFTDRETVDKTEKMKVCTCLNPLHTALAVFGCLLGYKSIHDEMDDEVLSSLVRKLGYAEGMPVVVDPKVISPRDFIKAVLELRLPNPFMPDTPQRIACDTSQKLPIRFGETIKAYRASSELSTDSLTLIPLVLAGWCRYLKGIDDEGNEFELSPDPLLYEVTKMDVKDILKKKEIFGVDLFEDGLADKILAMYEEMQEGPGSVRKVLKKYVDSVLA